MKQIDQPLPIFRLQVTETKVRISGGAPQAWARIALMTDEGITIADSSFGAWSEESWDLMRNLCKSIERDFEKTLRNRDHSQWGESAEREEEDGIMFNEEPWGIDK